MGQWQPVPIDRGDVGIRLDRVLQRHLAHVPGVTRNRLQQLIAGGFVRLNGHAAKRPAVRVGTGDRVVIALPDRTPRPRAAPEPLPLDIRFEDDGLLIVYKPAGQVAHPAFRHSSGTLLNAILAHTRGPDQPSLVSRLDKGTSGLVLVARTARMHARLQQLGARNAIEKDYLAIVHGKPPRRGTIDVALDRDPWDRRKVTVRDRGGVPSVTKFERVDSRDRDGQTYSLLRCRLITGRTHQIRVHLASKGWPIVGDPVYGRTGSRAHEADRAIGRPALHAWRLAFTHPVTGAAIDVTAPMPPEVLQAVGFSVKDGPRRHGDTES